MKSKLPAAFSVTFPVGDAMDDVKPVRSRGCIMKNGTAFTGQAGRQGLTVNNVPFHFIQEACSYAITIKNSLGMEYSPAFRTDNVIDT